MPKLCSDGFKRMWFFLSHPNDAVHSMQSKHNIDALSNKEGEPSFAF